MKNTVPIAGLSPGLPGEYDCGVFEPSRPGNDRGGVPVGHASDQTGGFYAFYLAGYADSSARGNASGLGGHYSVARDLTSTARKGDQDAFSDLKAKLFHCGPYRPLFVYVLRWSCCLIIAFGLCSAGMALATSTQGYSITTPAGSLFHVLQNISAQTGITISINHDANERVEKKSYTDQPLSFILSDLLRDKNKAILWIYASLKVQEVHIYIPPRTLQAKTPRVTFAPDNSDRSRHLSLEQEPDFFTGEKDVHPLGAGSGDGWKRNQRGNGAGRAGEASADIPYGPPSPGPDEQEAKNWRKNPEKPIMPSRRHGLEPPPMPPGM